MLDIILIDLGLYVYIIIITNSIAKPQVFVGTQIRNKSNFFLFVHKSLSNYERSAIIVR